MHHCYVPLTLLLLLVAVFPYQQLGADGAVTFNYTQDKEVMELAEEAAGKLAALVLKILEKAGKAELKGQAGSCPICEVSCLIHVCIHILYIVNLYPIRAMSVICFAHKCQCK